MTSLPLELPPQHQGDLSAKSAYHKCLAIEKDSLKLKDTAGAVGRNLVYVPILGHLFHFVPDITNLVEEVSSAEDDSALFAVGQLLYDHYICAFSSKRERTPTSSTHSSRRSFDDLANFVKSNLASATPSRVTAKKDALVRDSFRCPLTGRYDERIHRISELRVKLVSDPDPNAASGATECAHIFPESTNANVSVESTPSKTSFASSMWAVIAGFGYTNVPAEINGNLIHRLENNLTLSHDAHYQFDRLAIRFK